MSQLAIFFWRVNLDMPLCILRRSNLKVGCFAILRSASGKRLEPPNGKSSGPEKPERTGFKFRRSGFIIVKVQGGSICPETNTFESMIFLVPSWDMNSLPGGYRCINVY